MTMATMIPPSERKLLVGTPDGGGVPRQRQVLHATSKARGLKEGLEDDRKVEHNDDVEEKGEGWRSCIPVISVCLKSGDYGSQLLVS